MDNIKQRLITLLEAKKLTAEDSLWLLNYLEENDSAMLHQLMQTAFNENVEHRKSSANGEISQEILANIHQVLKIRRLTSNTAVYKMNWKKFAIAASFTFLLGLSVYFISRNSTENTQMVVVNNNTSKDVAAPSNSKATITLANGQTLSLDSLKNGLLASQGNVEITKTPGGQVIYHGDASETVYNTLSNPRGSTVINITLSDGTKVWLNSESSLKYPVAFSGTERKVFISGEAYFEVAKNVKMPFKVDGAGKGEVEVLGTHFNVSAYLDEDLMKTSLLEGSVKVKNIFGMVVIKPGQQSVATNVSAPIIKKSINMEEVIAWKNGLFYFDESDLKEVMMSIGRWYDLKVVYEGTFPPVKITGKIYRDAPVSKVLRILEALNIDLSVDGKTIFIRSEQQLNNNKKTVNLGALPAHIAYY